uniref:alpha-N-acetylgalactosaminide alpha-2,6-sialyltransferase n=1 Tax=Sinocyclocheilus grahami TaxID=75366 RepID=A0A672S8J4_SINGR
QMNSPGLQAFIDKFRKLWEVLLPPVLYPGFTTNSLKNSLIGYYQDGFDKVPCDPGTGYICIPAETGDYVMLAAAIQGVSVPSGPDKGDRPSELFGYNTETHQFKMIHSSFIQYVTERFLKSPQLEQYRDLNMPSTGALMLLIVSAYGFITENYKDFSDHYYDKVMKLLVFYANHDMEMEGCLWKQLHSQKVLWLYQRQKKDMM